MSKTHKNLQTANLSSTSWFIFPLVGWVLLVGLFLFGLVWEVLLGFFVCLWSFFTHSLHATTIYSNAEEEICDKENI